MSEIDTSAEIIGEVDAEALAAFWEYERALMNDDVPGMDQLFAPGPATVRADPGGLLVGSETIREFRTVRGGAPRRRIERVHAYQLAPDAVALVAITAAASGGSGVQTQVWVRRDGRWLVEAAHVAPPPATFDPKVWREVGAPLEEATAAGPLSGHTIAVKDVIAVGGHRLGGGVPVYLDQAEPQQQDAAALAALRAAGASIAGIARTDQFAYSLAGDNPHYGAPVNPAVPGGLPGGSSSGSSVATSLGAASIGLATDTAGSIRIPASYQGLWGWRPTHGAVSAEGVLPLAPDFDTVGAFARSPELLAQVASVLLSTGPKGTGSSSAERAFTGLLLPWREAPGLEPLAQQAWQGGLERLGLNTGPQWPGLADPEAVRLAFVAHQSYQAWSLHGEWIEANPGAVIGASDERFAAAAKVSATDDQRARDVLASAREELDGTLGHEVLVLPSAAGPAPKVWASSAEVDAHRQATFALTLVAGVTGRPAVSVPLLQSDQGPIGVCLVGPRGSDLALIALATTLEKSVTLNA